MFFAHIPLEKKYTIQKKPDRNLSGRVLHFFAFYFQMGGQVFLVVQLDTPWESLQSGGIDGIPLQVADLAPPTI